MENILFELVKQIPNAAAVILTVWLFLRAQREAEETRVDNAAKLEAERRTHEMQVNDMWAEFLKKLSADNALSVKQLVDEIHRHESASKERYDRMRITQKLSQAYQQKKKLNRN